MSKQQAMKSMNCISATGRMPMYAAPIAAPTMAVSEIGVSMTRASPKRSMQALGDLERAAVGADVLAEQEHALVARHLLEERLADRLEIGDDGHGPSSRDADANGDFTSSSRGSAKSSPA